jgi:hemoglobin
MAPKVPTLYEWLSGSEVLTRLIDRFYQKVPADPLLEHLFRSMPQAASST